MIIQSNELAEKVINQFRSQLDAAVGEQINAADYEKLKSLIQVAIDEKAHQIVEAYQQLTNKVKTDIRTRELEL